MRNNSKMFPSGTFFVFLRKCLLKFHKTSPTLKITGCVPALRHYSFCKMLHTTLNVWQCPEYASVSQ